VNAATIAVSAPYPEGGAMELAAAAAAGSRLEALVMPSRRASRTAAALALRAGRGDVARRLGRGAPDVAALREVLPWFEPARMAAGLPVLGGRLPDIHTLKAAFDRAVAGVDLGGARAVVAMPEAALETFRRHPDRLRVFHEVDGHPRARNEVLTRFYGADRAAGESHPPAIVARIEAELAVADLVLSPSAAVTAQMEANGVPRAKLLEAHLGVDLAAFGLLESAPARRAAAGPPTALYVGQISLRKGIPFLLEASKRSGTRVRMIGPMVDRSALDGMPDTVRYDGVLSHGGVAEAMRTADAFVFPTLEDAFGLVVVEAAATGLPVISTDGAGAAEVLGERDLRSVPIGDPVALADALAAVRPLAPEEREDRAARIREASAAGRLNDWATWSRAVLDGIDAAG
jgi:glycosyltransferase involved in cell wall biosynthesis